jgi:hypothetical protein
MNALELWATYADQLARLFRGARSLINARGDSWFAVHRLVDHRHRRPSSRIGGFERGRKGNGPLARAELRPAPLPEPLMSCQTRPAADSVPFAVSRVGREAELRTAIAICAEGHAIDQAILARLLARDLSREDDVSTWLAWDSQLEAPRTAALTAITTAWPAKSFEPRRRTTSSLAHR